MHLLPIIEYTCIRHQEGSVNYILFNHALQSSQWEIKTPKSKDNISSYYMPETKAGIIPNSISELAGRTAVHYLHLVFHSQLLEFTAFQYVHSSLTVNVSRARGKSGCSAVSWTGADVLQTTKIIAYVDRGEGELKLSHHNPRVEYC